MITAISTPESKKQNHNLADSFPINEFSPVVHKSTEKRNFSSLGRCQRRAVIRKNVTHIAGLVNNEKETNDIVFKIRRNNTTHVSKDFINISHNDVDVTTTQRNRNKRKKSGAGILNSISPLKTERKRKMPLMGIEKRESHYFSSEKEETESGLSGCDSLLKDVDLEQVEKNYFENPANLNSSVDLFKVDSDLEPVNKDLIFEDSCEEMINLIQSDNKVKNQTPSVSTSIPNIMQVLQQSSSSKLHERSTTISSQMDWSHKNYNNKESNGGLSLLSSNHFESTVFGISKLFEGETWNENSLLANSNNLSTRLKQQLLGNVSKLSSKIDTELCLKNDNITFSSEFELNNSLHELGPFFGLPSKVQSMIEQYKGISDLYGWQKECLNLHSIQTRRNLIYSLPTSGGKTLVAEILILREMLCHKKNALFILPFVAVVQEKVRSLSQFGIDLEFLVEEYAAGKGVIPPKKRRRKNSVIIATIEKGLSVIESLIEKNRLDEVGLVIVDELHLLSEESGRGSILEMLLTHLLYSKEKIHIVGMSATIGNLQELGQFLNADTYSGNFRPVELTEYVKCGNNIYTVDWKSEESLTHIRTLSSPSSGPDPDGICDLVQEVIPQECVLIFCPTKKNCENVALLLSNLLPKNLLNHKKDEKISLYRALANDSNGSVCSVLKKTLPYGVAYHHSGLTGDERKLLEEGFRDETLCVICCTSTLAAGVNLPARRVILRSPYIGMDFINLSKYKQMVGRAGRAGLGSHGESYLVCQSTDTAKVGQLLRSKMDDSVSKLDSNSCCDLVLSSIGLSVATTRRQLRSLLSTTLMNVQVKRLNIDIKKMTDECITKLYKQGALKVSQDGPLIEDSASVSKLDLNTTGDGNNDKKLLTGCKTQLVLTNDTQLTISRLGRAAMKGSMNLSKAHELYTDLIQAESSLVLLTSLHLLYIVTPYDISQQIKLNNMVYFNMYSQLRAKELQTAKIIGITDVTMRKIMTGQRVKNVSEKVLKRFYITMMLNELWKQQTVWEVSMLFQVPRGLVQNLMTSASSFASNVLRFCEELEELWPFKALLNEFTPRLAHCCSTELLPLMELPAVKKGRAKQLYAAGYKTLQLLASATPLDLVRDIDHLPKKVATQIIAAAKLNLLEKVENLKEAADEVLLNLGEPVLNLLNL